MPKITKINIERISDNYFNLDKFYEGWREGEWQKPDECQIIEGKSLHTLLEELSHNGYALTKLNGNHWRALSGEITRIDFLDTIDGWVTKKYPKGWTAKTQPLAIENKGKEFDLDSAILWLKKNHWKIMQWPGGARAWRYKVAPVRTAEEIRELRRLVTEKQSAAEARFDLAFVY